MGNNNIQIPNSNEIDNLKNELSKANQIIELQKLTINELENKLNNYNTINNNLNINIFYKLYNYHIYNLKFLRNN